MLAEAVGIVKIRLEGFPKVRFPSEGRGRIGTDRIEPGSMEINGLRLAGFLVQPTMFQDEGGLALQAFHLRR